MKKPTVIIGASENPDRYSYKATVSLKLHGHPVYPVGLRKGTIMGEDIQTGWPAIENVNTVTLYVGPQNQNRELMEYVIGLRPARVVFNPGTENPAFQDLLKQQGIEWIEACTLVMLSIGTY